MGFAEEQEAYRQEALMMRLQKVCFNQCCKDLSTRELTMDEVHCIDRCSWRFMRTNQIIWAALDKSSPPNGMRKK